VLLSLGLICFGVGLSMALAVPFLSLFLSTAVHAGPFRVTVFLIVAPLAGVLTSTLIGRLSDRWPIRRALLIGASMAGVIGMVTTAFVRDYWVLLAVAVTATALAGALFPQMFAYARQLLTGDGHGRAAMGINALRTVFSLAWVAGPPLAAFLTDAGGFAYLYGTSAAMYGVVALVAIFWLDELDAPAAPAAPPAPAPPAAPAAPPAPAPPAAPSAPPATAVPDALAAPACSGGGLIVDVPDPTETPRWTLLLTAAAFALLQCPLTLGVQALPLFIGADLHGDIGDAGLILGLCAGLEIPLILGFGALATVFRLRVLVLMGAGFGIAYYALAAATWSVGTLAVAQILNAVFIAAISGLGISYMQEMLPRHPGRATTLFSNSFPIGAILAGPLFGLSQHFGFRLAYGMSAGLCAAGLLILLMVRPVASLTQPPAPGQDGLPAGSRQKTSE
jgi:SET family sugar efflux transporter-like MFS transporter